MNQTLHNRGKVDDYYRELLANINGIRCIERQKVEKDNYAYFPIVISAPYPLSRDELFEKLKQHAVFARKYFYPLMTQLSVYEQYKSDTPNAKLLSEQVLCLPMYPDLKINDIQKIIQIIKSEIEL